MIHAAEDYVIGVFSVFTGLILNAIGKETRGYGVEYKRLVEGKFDLWGENFALS